MAISEGLIALAVIISIIVIAAAIYMYRVSKKIGETNIKLESARQEMAELKKNFEELKDSLSVLENKVGNLTKNTNKTYLASLEEWK